MAFRGFMAQRRGISQVQVPELPSEPLREILPGDSVVGLARIIRFVNQWQQLRTETNVHQSPCHERWCESFLSSSTMLLVAAAHSSPLAMRSKLARSRLLKKEVRCAFFFSQGSRPYPNLQDDSHLFIILLVAPPLP